MLDLPVILMVLTLHADLSGDMADIPSGISAGHPPVNNDFFFSDLPYETAG